jgi:hypothetical protein
MSAAAMLKRHSLHDGSAIAPGHWLGHARAAQVVEKDASEMPVV